MMSASKLIQYFSSYPAAFGFWSSSPPVNIDLHPANKKINHSLSDFQTGISGAVYATVDMEELFLLSEWLLLIPLSLQDSYWGVIPVQELLALVTS